MKWLKSMLTLFAIVSATAVGGPAFAYHRHWHQPNHTPRSGVHLEFNVGAPRYAPVGRYYYYEPSPHYYGPARRYYYYGQDAGYYYYYGEPVYDYSSYNLQFPQSED
jgi:hypothetical protein